MINRSALTFKRFAAWIEILFWDIAILLLSKSRIVQVLVRGSYVSIQNLRQSLGPTQLLVWAISGWGLGFLIGLLGSLVVR
ncbi:MAG: hypothetical protein P8Y03_03550 [Anaerolineales bacterium]